MTGWTDWLGNQSVECEIEEPRTVAEVIAAVTAAAKDGTRVRAIGSGHSTSDAARPSRGSKALRLEKLELDDVPWRSWLKGDLSEVEPRLRGQDRLERVPAGIPIRELNDRLAKKRLALPNLGSYDAQALYGAIATGTHGTGMVSGPLADLVASIELVTVEDAGRPTVRHYRIEPKNGITDRDRFYASSDRGMLSLIQDDDVFRSAVVSMGCFGIVTAVTLKVVPSFWLRERSEMIAWSEVRKTIETRARSEAWLDIVMLSEPLGGEHWCLVTTKEKRAASAAYQPVSALPARDDARKREAAKRDPKAQMELVRCGLDKHVLGVRVATELLRGIFEEEVARSKGASPIESESHVVFKTSVGDHVRAISSEIAVDIGQTVEAVDRTIAHFAAMKAKGFFHLSPIGIRFSKGSQHYLAMQYGRDTCTIEAPLPMGITNASTAWMESPPDAAPAILTAFERALIEPAIGGRPHWGQRHTVAGGFLTRYPKSARWKNLYSRFNRFGLFDSPFTGRMGLRP